MPVTRSQPTHRVDLDIRDQLDRPVHGGPRQPRRDDRPAGHPGELPGRPVRARVDRQRLHADVRRPAADRRRARRPLRPQADVHHRPRDLHRRLGHRRPLVVVGDAHRRPGDPGRRRRDRHPAHPDDPVGRGAGRAARGRPRRVGRDRRPGHRHRAGRRRGDRRGTRLAVDLLDQRPDRAHRDPAGALPADRDLRPEAAARPARSGHHHRRPAGSLV